MCMHGVEVNPTLKIRPTIDARYILQFCVNSEENPQEAQQPPSPPHVEEQQFQHGESSAAQPTNAMIYDQLLVIRASMEQMQLDRRADRAYFEQEQRANNIYFDHMTSQTSSVYRTNTYIHQELYNSIPEG